MNGLDFTRAFAAAAAAEDLSASKPGTKTRKEAETWLNVGYRKEVQVLDGEGNTVTETRFVSLPFGIPLDTQDPADTTKGSAQHRRLLAAKNLFLKQLQDAAAKLGAGEEAIIGGLEIQLRRVKDRNEAIPISAEENEFVQPLNLTVIG